MEDKSTYINWCDHTALPTLNPLTVIDYFCKPTNPFYDKTCNNEHLRMQGFGLVSEQLRSMEGVEYVILHTQPPDLYVIRKQHRSSPTQETPLVDYYIIRGVVFQAPDLATVLNVRLLNAVHSIRRALDEASSRGRFSLSKSAPLSWASDQTTEPQQGKRVAATNPKSRPSDNPDRPPTAFQKMHVDPAIAEMVRRFPYVTATAAQQQVVPAEKVGGQAQDAQQISKKSK